MRRSAILAFLVAFSFALPACAASDKKAPVHKITQSPSYVMIDPIYTTIMDGDKIVGMLMIGIGLDIPNAKLRADVNQAMPVLRDVYVRNLMEFTATSVRPWRSPAARYRSRAAPQRRANSPRPGCHAPHEIKREARLLRTYEDALLGARSRRGRGCVLRQRIQKRQYRRRRGRGRGALRLSGGFESLDGRTELACRYAAAVLRI
jgi:hypothetical protein